MRNRALAATRDASWFRNPGRAHKYHVVSSNGGSVCGIAILCDFTEAFADSVPAPMRCARAACKKAFDSAQSMKAQP